MPRGVKKENLPQKICVVCLKPYTWRKKWEKCWNEVTTCSKACNRLRKGKNRKPQLASASEEDDEAKDITADGNNEVSVQKDRSEIIVVQTMDDCSDATSMSQSASTTDNINQASAMVEFDPTDDEGDPLEPVNPENCASGDNGHHPTAKLKRRAERKAKKALKRAQKEGLGEPTIGKKRCSLCDTFVDFLIRCKHAGSPDHWDMVCRNCWDDVSGGVVDGDRNHPHYRYGGVWKNRRINDGL